MPLSLLCKREEACKKRTHPLTHPLGNHQHRRHHHYHCRNYHRYNSVRVKKHVRSAPALLGNYHHRHHCHHHYHSCFLLKRVSKKPALLGNYYHRFFSDIISVLVIYRDTHHQQSALSSYYKHDHNQSSFEKSQIYHKSCHSLTVSHLWVVNLISEQFVQFQGPRLIGQNFSHPPNPLAEKSPKRKDQNKISAFEANFRYFHFCGVETRFRR